MLLSETTPAPATNAWWTRWFFALGLLGSLLPSVVSGAAAWDAILAEQSEMRSLLAAWENGEGDGLPAMHWMLAGLSESELSNEPDGDEQERYISFAGCKLPLSVVLAPFGIHPRLAEANAMATRKNWVAWGLKPYALFHAWKVPDLVAEA